MPPPQRGHWRRRREAGPKWLRAVGRGGGAAGSWVPGMPRPPLSRDGFGSASRSVSAGSWAARSAAAAAGAP